MQALTSAAWALALFSIAAFSSEENTLAWVGFGASSDLGLAAAGVAAGCSAPAGASAGFPVAGSAVAAGASVFPAGEGAASPSLRINRMDDQTS